MIVKLNKAEMALTEQAGKLRWQLARAAEVKDRVIDKDRSPKKIDLIGIRAEVVVAKVLNLDFSASTLGIDSGGDLFIPLKDSEFLSVQVKSTFHTNGNLLFRRDCKFEFDLAVLVCQHSEDAYEIAGCISLQKINQKKFMCDKGKGYIGWQINRQDLAPISELWYLVQQRRFS